MNTTMKPVSEMDRIIRFLVQRIGSVDAVQDHINECIRLRHIDIVQMMDYVFNRLGHLLTVEQMVVFSNTIASMDRAIVSIEL